ncbi:hypothetical protein CK203_109333 [Vitis vinifera]|uniref:Integrase zinc-binding domain-containing protein n=1 Tax=Vitis vinifera TaxID=29760 RepID=A0A438CPZ3_VITVI|nr:hypothetical protein CK203_109333 [Vitis vinifera]
MQCHHIPSSPRRRDKTVYYVSKALVDAETSTSSGNLDKSTIEGHLAQVGSIWTMMKWVIELSEYDIQYKPHLSLEDGASRTLGARVELVLLSSTEEQIEQSIRLDFPASNNEVEYEAIMMILWGALSEMLDQFGGSVGFAKLHEGVYDNHLGGRTLAHRAYSQGYYWPMMKRDAEDYGMDIVGPLPTDMAQNKLLLVAIDYFSKWWKLWPMLTSKTKT